MSSQSGDNTEKPTALAKLYLEDGTVLTGISFGSHVSAEGEVCDSVVDGPNSVDNDLWDMI